MKKGYIKIWRKLQDSDFWLQEKFTRGQAWVDLIMLANYKDADIRKRGIRVELKRGDIGWSETGLANRWKWSRGKVRRFLRELCSENEQKLVQQNGPQNKNVIACYHIVKYDTYQDIGQQNERKTVQQTDRKQDNKRYREKEKKERVKKSKKKKKGDFPDWLNGETWNQFIKHRENGNKEFSEYAQDLAIQELEQLKEGGDDPNEIIKKSIRNGWSGLYPLSKKSKSEKDIEEWLENA